MSNLFSCVGEELLLRMAKANPEGFWGVCELGHPPDLPNGAEPAFIDGKLLPYAGHKFDGAHGVDLVLQTSETAAVGVEVKLGVTRLGPGDFRKLLETCRPSKHKDPRWCGGMPAILDRRFEGIQPPVQPLRISREEGQELTVLTNWILIARQAVCERLQGLLEQELDGRTPNVTLVCLEALTALFARDELTRLCRECFPADPVATWELTPAD